jgi:hypothetical protein
MSNNRQVAHAGRINVPGFSFGRKTGEYIDVPRIFGGHGSSRKSKKPHSTQELLGGRVLTQGRKALVVATHIARQEYNKGKRFRAKQEQKSITPLAVQPCTRRLLEFTGHHCPFIPFIGEPELIVSKPKTVFEVTDYILPIATFTSAREAQILAATLTARGYAIYINHKTVRRY